LNPDHRSPFTAWFEEKATTTHAWMRQPLQFTLACFGAFWFWVEEQRSCAEDGRAEARSTMALWSGEPWVKDTSD
jgi:hypothetical protein